MTLQACTEMHFDKALPVVDNLSGRASNVGILDGMGDPMQLVRIG